MKTPAVVASAIVCFVIVCASSTYAIAQQTEDGELVELVVGLLADNDKDVRALGLEQVRSSAKGSAATMRFAAQLPKLPAEAQVGLLGALADRGDVAAKPAVLEVLAASRDAKLRTAAINALGPLGDSTDTPRLVQLLAGGSTEEQAAARRSLVSLRGEDTPAAIAKEMKNAASDVRVSLIEILATRRGLATIPDIQIAAVGDDPAVRGAAMKALGQLASPAHITGMVQGVLKAEPGRERESAEKCVMFVCGRIDDPEKRAEPVLSAMEKLNESDRQILLSTLGRVGGSDALKTIEAAIGDPDPKIHELGVRALCNWPDASIAARLMELAATDDHPADRTRSLRALIRVAPLSDQRTDAERLRVLEKAMAMCTRDAERLLILDRARAIRAPESLRFILPYVDQPPYAEQACLSVVELAHHRTLREPNKAEFHRALDKVIQTSKDATVVDRANRYKKDQTWVRPTGS